MTFALEVGRGRVLLNEHSDKAHLTVDVGGAGYSVLLTPSQMNELADALREIAWQMTWGRP